MTIFFFIKAYVDYVTSTIRGKELFHSIDMKMTQSWDFLLWCDPSNYGGIRCLTPKDGDTEKTNPLEEGDFIFFLINFFYWIEPETNVTLCFLRQF